MRWSLELQIQPVKLSTRDKSDEHLPNWYLFAREVNGDFLDRITIKCLDKYNEKYETRNSKQSSQSNASVAQQWYDAQ